MSAGFRAMWGLFAAAIASAAALALLGGVGLFDACFYSVIVCAWIGALMGAWGAPPGRRLFPRLVAAALSLSVLGDVIAWMLGTNGVETDVTLADAFWVAASLAFCAGPLIFVVRNRRRGQAPAEVALDALTIGTVGMVIVWTISIDSIFADDTATTLERLVWSTYPIAHVVLLALLIRLTMSPNVWRVLGGVPLLAASLSMAADIAYLQFPTDETAAILMRTVWMVVPVLLAVMTWRLRSLDPEVSLSAARRGRAVPLAIAVGPLLIPASLEVLNGVLGRPQQPGVLILSTVVLVALAFVRTARLIGAEDRAQRELVVAKDEALEASRAKSLFVANMSHEIRTPLATVLAAAEMLGETPLTETQQRWVSKMDRSGRRLHTLIEEVLDFSRIEAGQLNLRAAPFNLHALVNDVVETYAARASGQGISFEFHRDPRVPADAIGDPVRVYQVVSNLLNNAMKFTHVGHVGLDVRPGGTDAKPLVEFSITDTGIGIDRADLTDVFESFTQVDGSTTRQYGGSGLGLAICKDLAQAMGGTIEASSTLGEGSTFVVRLPLLPVQPEPPVIAAPSSTPRTAPVAR